MKMPFVLRVFRMAAGVALAVTLAGCASSAVGVKPKKLVTGLADTNAVAVF